jgi:hypothetical protein
LSSATDRPLGGNAAVRSSIEESVGEVSVYWKVYPELVPEAVQ